MLFYHFDNNVDDTISFSTIAVKMWGISFVRMHAKSKFENEKIYYIFEK
jgi:hypothetical protein